MTVLASRLYELLKREGSELFEGSHAVHTPRPLVEEILGQISVKNKSILVLFNMEFAVSLVHTSGVDPADITVYIDHPNKGALAKRLGVKYITNLDIDMKFDVIVGNPPYQKPKSDSRMGSRGASELWAEFVNKGLSLLKDNGHVAFIHPNAWRKPEDRNDFWKLLTQDNQMEKLVMSSGKGGLDWFGIGVRVDYYILQKKAKYKNTVVVDHEGVIHDLDLANFDWLPNYAIDEIAQLLGKSTSVLYNTFYHTQKKHSDILTKDCKYPVVHTINKSGLGIKYFDRLQENDTTHYGIAKVLLNQNELQYPYNDYKGEYGMSQLTFGIAISSKEEGEEIIEFLNSNKGKRLIASTKWNTYYTDYGMFKSFKKDWYK